MMHEEKPKTANRPGEGAPADRAALREDDNPATAPVPNEMPGKRADLPAGTLSKPFFGRTGDEQRDPKQPELAVHARVQGQVGEKKS